MRAEIFFIEFCQNKINIYLYKSSNAKISKISKTITRDCRRWILVANRDTFYYMSKGLYPCSHWPWLLFHSQVQLPRGWIQHKRLFWNIIKMIPNIGTVTRHFSRVPRLSWYQSLKSQVAHPNEEHVRYNNSYIISGSMSVFQVSVHSTRLISKDRRWFLAWLRLW